MSFVYTRLIEELQDRWRIEYQAALVGWHMAGAMASDDAGDVARPALTEWPEVKRAFDDWLLSGPDDDPSGVDGEPIDPEQLDLMIAYGWRD